MTISSSRVNKLIRGPSNSNVPSLIHMISAYSTLEWRNLFTIRTNFGCWFRLVPCLVVVVLLKCSLNISFFHVDRRDWRIFFLVCEKLAVPEFPATGTALIECYKLYGSGVEFCFHQDHHLPEWLPIKGGRWKSTKCCRGERLFWFSISWRWYSCSGDWRLDDGPIESNLDYFNTK